MVNDKDIARWRERMAEWNDYDCDADRYVELVDTVATLRDIIKRAKAAYPGVTKMARILEEMPE